jgi:hypothetical protein
LSCAQRIPMRNQVGRQTDTSYGTTALVVDITVWSVPGIWLWQCRRKKPYIILEHQI